MTELTLKVPDISCDHCRASIEGAVGLLDGVRRVRVDVAERTVEVAFDGSLDVEAIVEAVEAQGYRVADRS